MDIKDLKNIFSSEKQEGKTTTKTLEKSNIKDMERDFSLQNELNLFLKRWPILKFIDESLLNLNIENISLYKKYDNENKEKLEDLNLKNIEYLKKIFKS